jgi:hypothetical protein
MEKFGNTDLYWASEPDTIQLIGYLSDKVSLFDRHLDMSGRWLTARDLYYNYFLINETNYTFPTFGADGFKRLNINHFRSILKHMLSLVTAQRVSPEPIATNTDYRSQAQVNFCKNILRYLGKEKKLDKQFESATEIAVVLGAAYISREWDASIGEPYTAGMATPPTPAASAAAGAMQRKGDFKTSVYNWLDVIFDFAQGSYDECQWKILRKYVNRWDLVARFPVYADQIKNMSVAPEVKRHRLGHIINEQNDDLIPLYTFYHDKSTSIPNGRMTMFLDSNTCLFDGSLPYKRIPVSRISADDQIDSPFAYSVSMDLLPIQKVYNALCSAVCTNQAAFGVQNILIPRDAAISLSQLTEGLNAIYYDSAVTQGAKPEPLNLLMNKQEVFNWIEYLEKKMAQISGVNDTIQGNPEANLKSGTALAFVASQALTFISPLSRSYNGLIEDTWTGIIDILKEYATTPRMILISGVANKAQAAQFTAKEIEDIDRVIVEAGNPLTDTLAGRIQVAQDMLQAGLTTKEEYLNVLMTGQLEPAYQYENALVMQLKEENEQLQNGKPVKAMASDNHPLHMREHTTLLNSPEVRDDPNPNNPINLSVTQHILDHMTQWSQMDPRLGAALGVPPPPPPPQPPQPPAPPVPKEMISFKDMPPDGQAQMAAQAGIHLAPPMGIPGAPPPPMPPPPMPVMPGHPNHPGNAGKKQPTGRENPNGAKTPGAPNIPGMMQANSPFNLPGVKPPAMPPGSPAMNQDANARMAANQQLPQLPH